MPSPNIAAEGALSDLAITELSDRLPGLFEYLLGFELIYSNAPENTRAAGVLGFDISGQRLLIPVLFLNGRIKGMEILYLADTDTFVSATPQWVEYLTSQNSGLIGQSAPEGHDVGSVPSAALRIFNRPPQVTKTAGFEQAEHFVENLADVQKVAAFMTEPARLPDALVKVGKKAAHNFLKDVSENFPQVFEKMAEFYGMEALMPEFPADEPAAQKVASAPAEKKLAFVTLSDLQKNPADYDQETKLAVMKDGIAIFDKRAADETSDFYEDDYASHFQAPHESGFFSMFNFKGALVDVLIAHNPFNPLNPRESSSEPMIINRKSGVYFKPRVGDEVLVRPLKDGDSDEFEKFHKGLSEVSSAKPNSVYVLVGSDRRISTPFSISNKTVNGDKTTLKIQTSFDFNFSKDSNPWAVCSMSSYEGHIQVVKDGREQVRLVDSLILLSDGWKIFKLDDDSIYNAAGACCIDDSASYEKRREAREKREADKDNLRPASQGMIVDSVLAAGISEIEVTKKEAEYIVRHNGRTSYPFSKTAALRTLTGVLGLPLAASEKLVNIDSVSGVSAGYCKIASIYSGMPFPEMENQGGVNELGVMEENSVHQAEEVPMNNPQNPGDFDQSQDGYSRIRKQDMDFLMKASESGAKNVFDPAMIGILLKTNRTQVQLDDWIPDSTGALDKLCRTLILFYWKNTDFSESYGNDELAEFEDILLNTIKSLGSIILFLKQRSSDPADTKIDAFAN